MLTLRQLKLLPCCREKVGALGLPRAGRKNLAAGRAVRSFSRDREGDLLECVRGGKNFRPIEFGLTKSSSETYSYVLYDFCASDKRLKKIVAPKDVKASRR